MINVLPFDLKDSEIIHLAIDTLHMEVTKIINFENSYRRNPDNECDTGYICHLYNLRNEIDTVRIKLDDYMDYFKERK